MKNIQGESFGMAILIPVTMAAAAGFALWIAAFLLQLAGEAVLWLMGG